MCCNNNNGKIIVLSAPSGTGRGTTQVERVTGCGKNLIMDIDVEGALNVKKRYGDRALLIFIEPPTLQSLEERLRSRATDDDESIRRRLDKAEYETSFADRYDKVVVNDNLDTAVAEVADNIRAFTE